MAIRRAGGQQVDHVRAQALRRAWSVSRHADLASGARRIVTALWTSSSASYATRSTPSSPKHTFIQTRYGVGYKLEAVRK